MRNFLLFVSSFTGTHLIQHGTTPWRVAGCVLLAITVFGLIHTSKRAHNFPGDRVHHPQYGFAWLILPSFGCWWAWSHRYGVMLVTSRFHNCTGTRVY